MLQWQNKEVKHLRNHKENSSYNIAVVTKIKKKL